MPRGAKRRAQQGSNGGAHAHSAHSYYALLEVSPDAPDDEIKRSYRRLALKHHPDKVAEEEKDDAERRFQAIAEAYSVLSDEAKRAAYDRYGPGLGEENEYDDDDMGEGVEVVSDAHIAEAVLSVMLGVPPGARPWRRHYSDDEPEFIGLAERLFFSLVQLVPMLLLFGMVVWPPPSTPASLTGSAAPFVMLRDPVYSLAMRTAATTPTAPNADGSAGQITYYVTPHVGETLQEDASLRALVEEAVEATHRKQIEGKCAAEERAQRRQIDVARRLPKGEERQQQLDRALELPLPHCKLLAAAA